MTAREIFTKTMPFSIAKLVLGLVTVGASLILFLILMGIGLLFGEEVGAIMLIIWVGATGAIRFFLMHYIGYLVKAGHVAVIATAVTTGQIPANQVEVGKQMVKDRFVESNVYFAVDKLVSGAVKQLQNVLQKAGNALDFIPGMSAVVGVGQFFIEISLGYIDECCLGYTFYKKEQGAFKSAADGVVIYAQNWKVLLKNAAKTMLLVILAMVVVVIVVFLALGLLFKALGWNGLVAFLLACLIAWTLKFAFMDSYILVKTMKAYMEVAPSTEITFDLYGKLCGISAKFKELFQKGQQEQPSSGYAQAGEAAAIPVMASVTGNAGVKPIFCGQCGAKNDPGTKFCGSCGAKI